MGQVSVQGIRPVFLIGPEICYPCIRSILLPIYPVRTGFAFPRGAVIRTLLRDVRPDELASGPTLFHEHLSQTWPPWPVPGSPAQPNFFDDVNLMIEEVRAASVDGGVTCLVDASHPDMFRKLDNLKRIAQNTRVHVVACAGYYMERTYPAELASRSDDQIAEDLAREATRDSLGAFGEIGESSNAPMTPLEEKVFRAVGKAHTRTNLPILTHNAYGTGPNVPRDAGLHQLDVLESVGVRPEHVAIGHTCCLADPKAEVIKQIAKRGAFVGFDRVTAGFVRDAQKVTTILAFLDGGYADRLLLSSDFYAPPMLKKNGGAGVAQAVTVFAPMLRKAGVSDSIVHGILVDNPRRFLAFVPKS